MIRKTSALHAHVFLSQVASTIGRSEHCRIDEDRIERGSPDPIYLAGGYWRALPIWGPDAAYLVGVHLVNPDRTPAQCAAVEAGIAVLLGEVYTPD